MENETNKKSGLLQEIFDSLFIMIICFATLLTAMLLKGKTVGVAGYVVDIPTLAIAVAGLVIYLMFILKKSDKELKDIMAERYRDKNSATGGGKL